MKKSILLTMDGTTTVHSHPLEQLVSYEQFQFEKTPQSYLSLSAAIIDLVKRNLLCAALFYFSYKLIWLHSVAVLRVTLTTPQSFSLVPIYSIYQ